MAAGRSASSNSGEGVAGAGGLMRTFPLSFQTSPGIAEKSLRASRAETSATSDWSPATIDPKISAREFEEFAGKNAESAAAEDDGAAGLFADAGAKGIQAVEIGLLLADQDIVDVAQRNPSEMGPKIGKSMFEGSAGKLHVVPPNLLTGYSQSRSELRQAQREHRVRRGTPINADQ